MTAHHHAAPARSRRRRRLITSVAVLPALTLLVSTSAGAERSSSAPPESPVVECDEPDVLRTGASPALAYAPPQIANDEGFLAKYCIELETIEIAGAGALLAEVQSGRTDLGLLNPAGIVQALQSGIDLHIIAPNTEPGDFALVTAADNDEINELADFEGATLASSLIGANTDIAIQIVLEQAGVTDIEFVQIPSSNIPQAIINHQVDGGQGNEPALTQFADEYKIIHDNPMVAAFGEGVPVTYAYVTGAYLEEHPDMVCRYQLAYLDVARLLDEDDTPFREAAVSFGQLPAEVAETMRLPGLGTDYQIDELMNQLNALAEYGSLEEPITREEMEEVFVPLPESIEDC